MRSVLSGRRAGLGATLALALLASCAGSPYTPPATPQPDVAELANAAVARSLSLATPKQGPNLYEVQIPSGLHGGINIDWLNDNGAEHTYDEPFWLDQGYDGIRFQGAGMYETTIRCDAWDGITVAVRQHNGIVEIADMTVLAGNDKGIAFGEQNLDKDVMPKFQLRLLRSRVIALHPSDLPDNRRTKWLVFTYQADLYYSHCIFIGKEAVEHDSYAHGFADFGAIVEHCTFESSGAEGFKVRPDATETASVEGDVIYIKDTTFRDWYQEWSWRGGAGVVIQGGAAHVKLERCSFFPGEGHEKADSARRSYAIAISAEGESYDTLTGQVSVGYGNGFVLIKNCAMYSTGPGPSWYQQILRVGRNGGSQQASMGVLIDGCGIWGEQMNVEVDETPYWGLWKCNTPSIKEFCDGLGMDTSHEASFIQNGIHPVSEGFAVKPAA